MKVDEDKEYRRHDTGNNKRRTMNYTNGTSLAEIYRCTLPELRPVTLGLDDWEHNIKLIWYIGTGFSALGYLLMVLTAIMFPVWRQSDQNRIWMFMTTSNLAWTLLFISRDFSKCMGRVMLILLIYTGQVCFFWMLAGAWLTYRKLVTVFRGTETKFQLKVLSYTWLAPLPFCAARGALEWVDHPDILFDRHASKVKIKFGNHKIGLINIRDYIFLMGDLSMYFPVFLVYTVSFVVYVLVLYTLYKNRRMWGKRQNRGANAAIGILFLFSSGAQFLFVVVNRFNTFTKLDYFSACLTTFNVFFYSVLFIFATRETRQLWLNFIKKNILR